MSLSPVFYDFLKELELFIELDNEQMQKVLESGKVISVKTGEVVFEQNDPAEHFYVVYKGALKLSLLSEEGCEKIVELIKEGEYCAVVIMFQDDPVYPVTGVALETTELLTFDIDTYLSILEGSFATNKRLLKHMTMRLKQLISEIDNLCLRTATYRLINYLVNTIPDNTSGNTTTIRLNAAKNVVAKQLSIQGETFSRILKDLRKNSLIEVKGQEILIKDITELKALLK